jgi:hypothetical protein
LIVLSLHCRPVLEAVPHEQRSGAIVKGEHGLPIRERSYRKWFQFACAAGIPDEVWSMDSRAGSATDADVGGADLKSIQDLLTHTTPRTTVRYIRSTSTRTRTLAKARPENRGLHRTRTCPCRKLKLEHIGGVAHLKSATEGYDLPSGRRAGSAHLSSTIGEFGPRCSTFDKK